MRWTLQMILVPALLEACVMAGARPPLDVRVLHRGREAIVASDIGRGDPPVVFIHGLAGDAGQWQRQIDEMSREHRVIAYDVREWALCFTKQHR